MHYKYYQVYNPQKGFTLLEILLVMLLLAGVASMVVLNLPNAPQQTLKQTIDKLTIQLQQVSDNALIQGEIYGLSVEHDGYELMQLLDNQWQLVSDEKQNIDDNVTFTLSQIEGRAIGNNRATSTDKPQKNKKDKRPNIIFFPDGTVTPFEMQISYQTAEYQLSVNALGEIKSNAVNHSEDAITGDKK